MASALITTVPLPIYELAKCLECMQIHVINIIIY